MPQVYTTNSSLHNMHTSMHIVAPQSKAMQPRQRLQHTPPQAALQLPRSTAVSGQHAARNMGQRPLQPPCSAHRHHASSAAANHSAARVGLKRHVRGWGSYQLGTCTRRGGVVAASDDDDSSALSTYSSSESSSSDTSSGSGSEAEAAAPPDADADGSAATIQLDMPRRSMQVTFTCDKCGARTARKVNPLAWDKGLVLAQCGGCEAWHKLRDAGGLVQEIRYTDEQP